MARIGFISITAILILFFAVFQALGGSGNQAASIAGTPAVPPDTASWPPIATCPGDYTLFVCDLSDICVDGFVCSDPDGNLASCVVSPGTLHGDTVCFTPMAGANTITLIATDQGGAADTCETTIYVVLNSPPVVSGMTDSTLYLCYPQEICLTVNVFDPDDDIDSIWVNRGNYENGKVCFIPYDSGHYEIIVTAVDSCGNMGADTALVVIETDQGISIECPNDTTIFTCQLVDTFCLPISGIPENAEVEVWGISTWYDAQTQTICFWSECSNTNHITVHVTTPCNTYSCEFTVTVECNSPPLVILPPDTTIPMCEAADICLPLGISDPDGNLTDVYFEGVEGAYFDPAVSKVCFTPDTMGTYILRVTAVDSCEATDWDEITVEVMLNSAPYISYELIDSIFSQCAPEEICIPVDIGDVDGNLDTVTTSFGYYDAQTGEVCFTPESTGRYCLQIITTDLCGLSDTAEICVIVEIGNFVQIDCPSDTDVVLCEPDTLCRQYTVSSDVDSVTVTAPAYLSGQEVCVPLLQTNDYLITMTAYGECGVDTCMFTVTAQFNRPPVVDAGDDTTFTLCDLSEICVPFTASDSDNNITDITVDVNGSSVVVNDGLACFTPEDFGTYEIIITAVDECNTTVDSVLVEILEKDDCDVCVRLSIDGGECTPVGVMKKVDLRIETNTPIGGFDILLNYDVSVMTFQSAHITGTQIEDWEYFTYNFSADLGLIQFVGLAETNDGLYNPPDSALTPNGVLIVTQFLVTNDQNLGGYFLPINFVWFDCGDNAFSDPTGNDLYVDLRIYNAEGGLIWDEKDSVTYPESDRLYAELGAPDTCVEGGGDDNPAPIRCIEFINGGILVIHPDSFDKRGDINLNGIPNEIADAVLFSNYFIYGLGVFRINLDGQVAASDVNADGMTLTVGDLVYLIRIIIGDADPIPKVVPYAEELIVSTDHDVEAISITTEAVSTIGAALFVYDISGDLVLDEPQLSPDAKEMDLMWTVENGELKMLIYNIGTSMIPTGVNDLVEIPCRGDGQLNLIRAEVVDYQGRPYQVAGKESELPTGFALNQNYPNPFNPTTTISFRLPQSTEWRLEIFNITGSLVREYRGSSETGAVTVEWDGRSTHGLPVASGVYLYRLEAANFSDSKKMILLK